MNGTRARMADTENAGRLLDALSAQYGIQPSFRNAHGQTLHAAADTKRALLQAMGVDAETETACAAALAGLDDAAWEHPLPPVRVVRLSQAPVSVLITLPGATRDFAWRLTLESGEIVDGQADFGSLALQDQRESGRERRVLELTCPIPWGYHALALPGMESARTTLIVTPAECWLPPSMQAGGRIWGVSAQLYLLRSQRDWGIGDFGDLRHLAEITAAHGADVIGLNPLHAGFLDNPEHASPYSPASRLLLNPLYIDVQDLPARHGVLPSLFADEAFRARLAACRAAQLVDYRTVAALKLQVLTAVYQACRADAASEHWLGFGVFQRGRAAEIGQGCLFLALRAHFAEAGTPDWRHWPAAYQDPASPEVVDFARTHEAEVTFQVWLQFLADTQLAEAAAAASGMAVGLYRDLAVGADQAGAETWSNKSAVVAGVQVGVPPDIYTPGGQDWGLPPFSPRALHDEAYRSFIQLVRANMRHAGGLRIDHVMGLQQLYWIPEGCHPAAGAYVRYPLEDLVGILALESQRHRCLVVGEDLGTVPEGFREIMSDAGILSYRVMFFERAGTAFLPPRDYPVSSVAVAGSHDLPTLRAWMEGSDIALRDRLALFVAEGAAAHADWERGQDRAALLDALRVEGLLDNIDPSDLPALTVAVHRFLARTPAAMALVQLDDITMEPDPVNVPSTSDQHPNWRRRLSLTLEQLAQNPLLAEIGSAFAAERAHPAAHARIA